MFAFVHTYEPHAPYLPPAEYEGQKFRGRFTKDGYHGEFRRRYDEMSKKSGHDTASAGAFLKNPEGMTDEDVEFIRGLYDENVLWTDSGFGRLIRTWSQHRRLSNTILVIVSDHGEQLGEHGWFGHGVGAYAELTRVPLIIVVPKGPNGVIETPVELAAVPATILELLGLDPTPDMEPSLMPLLGKAVEPRAEAFFFDVDGPNWSALHLERQVVLSPPRNARDSVYTDWNAYMWNFEEDPGGIIPRKLDEEATRLRDLLLDRAARDLEYQAERPLVTIAREEDAGERALLEELGYVGHSDEGDDGAPPPNDPPNGGGR
ncbi:MAG: sulfatase-like hydrolase/transferase [Planctomycetota bacterium]